MSHTFKTDAFTYASHLIVIEKNNDGITATAIHPDKQKFSRHYHDDAELLDWIDRSAHAHMSDSTAGSALHDMHGMIRAHYGIPINGR